MKHYLKENGYEYTNIRERRWVCCKRKTVRDAKQAYRQRERRALNRLVDELVVEELGNDSDYWESELDKLIYEHGWVVDDYSEAERRFERYGIVPDWDYYESRFDELRKRIDAVNRELYAA